MSNGCISNVEELKWRHAYRLMRKRQSTAALASISSALQVRLGLAKVLDGCANHWMPQEINMTADVATWKSSDGLSEDERRIVMRSLGYFSTADLAGGQ